MSLINFVPIFCRIMWNTICSISLYSVALCSPSLQNKWTHFNFFLIWWYFNFIVKWCVLGAGLASSHAVPCVVSGYCRKVMHYACSALTGLDEDLVCRWQTEHTWVGVLQELNRRICVCILHKLRHCSVEYYIFPPPHWYKWQECMPSLACFQVILLLFFRWKF